MPGVDELRRVVILLVIVAFAVLYIYFDIQVLQAANGQPPGLPEAIVGAAATVSGALGAAFAVAMGVKGPEAERAPGLPALKTILGFGLWVYVAVGFITAAIYLLNPQETPGAVSGVALAFLGYAVAIATGAYKTAS